MRRYSEVEFRAAVADPEVRSVADLCRQLRIVPRGGNYESVRRYAGQLGVDISHLEPRVRQRALDFTDDELTKAVAATGSVSATIRALGGRVNAASRRQVKDGIARLRLDTSHHAGEGVYVRSADKELIDAVKDISQRDPRRCL